MNSQKSPPQPSPLTLAKLTKPRSAFEQVSLHLSQRPRRSRQSLNIRDLIAETQLSAHHLIWPVFAHSKKKSEPIKTLPGVLRWCESDLFQSIELAMKLGIKAIALFSVIEEHLKDELGSEAINPKGFNPNLIRKIKDRFGEITLIADIALDPYTTHGQDGLINSKGEVVNDATVRALVEQSIILAQAGADVLAPSDMMDGRIGAIRHALEASGLSEVVLLSYSNKYASHFYGPFRDAVGSRRANQQADKRGYQMDYRNVKEAFIEAQLDIEQGADWLMVKPAGFYLDMICRLSQKFHHPILAYQVSGEYAMLKLAAKHAEMDYEGCLLESLVAIKRAGARSILTYGALDFAQFCSSSK